MAHKTLEKEGHFVKVLNTARAINARFEIDREIRAGYIMLDLRKAVSNMDLGAMVMSSKELIQVINESSGGDAVAPAAGGGTWTIITNDPVLSGGGTVGDGGYLNTNEGLGWSEGEYGSFGSASEELTAWYEVNGGP